MADFYAKGLIDPNFQTSDRKNVDSSIASGRAAAYAGSAGQQLGSYIPLLQADNPEADLYATNWPTLTANGEKLKYKGTYEIKTSQYTVITSSCEEPEKAMQFLDYYYGDDAKISTNFGVEGRDYTMVDGAPVFTDVVLAPADGRSVAATLTERAWSPGGGPFIQMGSYQLQYYVYQQSKDALSRWYDVDWDYREMPPVSLTADEADEFARIMADVNTYNDENTIKIIGGQSPVSEIDAFQAGFEGMNIARAIEIQQAAVDRYNAR
jgi:putative aldouronate transport system substrate-binding protein